MADEKRSLPVPDPARRMNAPPGPTLRFERTRHPSGAVIVRATGSVDDHTAGDLWTELGISSEEDPDLVLDLSGVDFLGTAGVTALLEVQDVVSAEGGRLRVACGSSRAARRALQVTGAMEMLEIVDRAPGGPSASSLFLVPEPGIRLDGSPRR